ncbi:MAG: prolipoprotein diacylglyceryl transferase [Deltaproteobacteria bacterium]|nr:prolipoprotein diacylglyceryl transferase [Deltaproteobacteria bacterium]
MHPILIDLGPIVIRWYGVMIAAAVVVGWRLAEKEAGRKGLDPRHIERFLLLALPASLAGARLYYVGFDDLSRFRTDPLSLLAIQEGGLAVHGAILGGLITAVVFSRLRGIPFLRLADTLTPSLILGQAVGRVGCFLNGDAFGRPTSLPWGVVFSSESPAGTQYGSTPLHPTQLYEMALCGLVFAFLWKRRRHGKEDGWLFFRYMILYSGLRLFVEQFRADRLILLDHLPAAQVIGVIGIGLGVIGLIVLRAGRGSTRPDPLR